VRRRGAFSGLALTKSVTGAASSNFSPKDAVDLIASAVFEMGLASIAAGAAWQMPAACTSDETRRGNSDHRRQREYESAARRALEVTGVRRDDRDGG
jgi:hypothetical protein